MLWLRIDMQGSGWFRPHPSPNLCRTEAGRNRPVFGARENRNLLACQAVVVAVQVVGVSGCDRRPVSRAVC